ncbi:hypothetical protein HPG69_006078, partial [Diceros bicornis minor]
IPEGAGQGLFPGCQVTSNLRRTCGFEKLETDEGVKTENNDHINLKVAGQDGSVGLSMRQIRFRFDGQPINETDTPAQLY